MRRKIDKTLFWNRETLRQDWPIRSLLIVLITNKKRLLLNVINSIFCAQLEFRNFESLDYRVSAGEEHSIKARFYRTKVYPDGRRLRFDLVNGFKNFPVVGNLKRAVATFVSLKPAHREH